VWLTFAMREGKNREIRNVLRALGLQVNRLIRVSFGPFQLGDLPAGEVTEIKTRMLREQLGEHLVALSGADFSAPVVEREVPAEKASARAPEARGGDVAKPRRLTKPSSSHAQSTQDRTRSTSTRPAGGRHRRPVRDDGKNRRGHRGKRDR
jgi:23S rRNA pseudouridine2605 synthase